MPLLTAEYLPKSLRIAVRGGIGSHLDFLHSLPNARKVGMALGFDATPVAAWRLMNESGATVQADDETLRLAARFTEARRIVAEGLPKTQPAMRRSGFNLWPHQVDAYHFAMAHDASMLALKMGEGKSVVAILVAVNRGCRTILVVCPKSVLPVWRREFHKHCPVDANVVVLDKGDGKKKRDTANAALNRANIHGETVVVVVNYETARSDTFAVWALQQRWDCVIGDESHRFGNSETATTKFMVAVGKNAKHRLCLTGTPMGNPLNLFGQFEFLDRGIFGTSAHRFRHRYAVYGNPTVPQMVTGYANLDELRSRFHLLAFRVEGEVQQLPPMLMHDLPVTLGSGGKRVYAELKDELIADLGSGEVVTAGNPLVKYLRLRQIVSGFTVEDETKALRWVDLEKSIALEELLAGLDDKEPVAVFCEFKAELQQVREIAAALGRRYGEVSGAKEDLTPHGEFPPDIDVLGVQYQSGGVGIDLTRAAYAVFFSPTWSLITWEQALKRVHRPGQTRTVHCYRIISEGTVDEQVYKALDNKKEVVDEVMRSMGVVPVEV